MATRRAAHRPSTHTQPRSSGHPRLRTVASHAALLSAGLTLLGATPAQAQSSQQNQGFALDRFNPSERGSDFFVGESLDLRGAGRFALGAVGDYANKPLVLLDGKGNELAAVVEHQLFAHLGGSVVLWDRVRFGVSLPVAVYQAGESHQSAFGTLSSDNNATLGDLRLGADVRLLGSYDDPMTTALGVQVHAPLGSQSSYTGDGKVRIVPRAMVAGLVGWFVYSGQLGFDYRAGAEPFAGEVRGSELRLAVAAGIQLDHRRWVLGPELYTSTVATEGGKTFLGTAATPAEVLLGAHWRATESLRLGAGVGPGLSQGLGSPAFRGLLSVEWVQPTEAPPPPPPPPPADRDADTIVDEHDACPDQPGPANADPAKHGCPPPPDRDGDTILDAEDACPDVAGLANADPKRHGCPPPGDKDGDGITDDVDACPEQPGVATQDPATNGCPNPDRDADSILNEPDACPDAAGPASEDPKKNGCPAARVEQGQIKIVEQVQFAYNSAKLLKVSDTILEAVRAILEANPHIAHVEVQGHTDDKGSATFNKRLSQQRAESVMEWLSTHGIAKERLNAVGFGEERPKVPNDTEEGRANNRRVEFHISADSASPEAAPAPSADGSAGAAPPPAAVPAPAEPAAKPTGPAAKPTGPAAKPTEPAAKPAATPAPKAKPAAASPAAP